MANRRKQRVRIRVPKRLEASIEGAAVKRIQERWPDVIIRKMNGGGNRNWPDRALFFSHDLVVFIEFKRPGEDLRPGQLWMKEKLEEKGYMVFVAEGVNDLMNQLAVTVMDAPT